MSAYFNPRGLYRPRPIGSLVASTIENFNPRGLYRPRQMSEPGKHLVTIISIHEAYTGLDKFPYAFIAVLREFQSTRPIQASTILGQGSGLLPGISIHEAYTGLDVFASVPGFWPAISIHEAYTGLDSPGGISAYSIVAFQSTRPIQASTFSAICSPPSMEISIHEAYTGLDLYPGIYNGTGGNFNPRGLYRPRRLPQGNH